MSSDNAIGVAATAADLGVELRDLRRAIREEYEAVAREPDKGFHFHTGRRLAGILGYEEEWLKDLPESAIESFAGTGCPFRVGELETGEKVVDVGCGAGIDSLIAAGKVGPGGEVIGVDMTSAMLEKARRSAKAAGQGNVDFRSGYMEELPVEDGWADVVISNGVVNLSPDKAATFGEMARVLKPTGRLQIGDILVQKQVPEDAKRQIDLWTG